MKLPNKVKMETHCHCKPPRYARGKLREATSLWCSLYRMFHRITSWITPTVRLPRRFCVAKTPRNDRSLTAITRYALLVLSLICLTSCSTGGRDLDELEDSKGVAKYLISSGDTLKVEVWKEPNLSGEVFVREDGSFTMSLIDDVKAAGLTPKQLAESVTNRLTKFIPAAAVTVSLVQASAVRYYLAGQFNKPGEFRSDKTINLLQALATGGGFAPFADESEITLIRKGVTGEELRYVLNYNKIIDGNQPNPQLKSGDFISVK